MTTSVTYDLALRHAFQPLLQPSCCRKCPCCVLQAARSHCNLHPAQLLALAPVKDRSAKAFAFNTESFAPLVGPAMAVQSTANCARLATVGATLEKNKTQVLKQNAFSWISDNVEFLPKLWDLMESELGQLSTSWQGREQFKPPTHR